MLIMEANTVLILETRTTDFISKTYILLQPTLNCSLQKQLQTETLQRI